MTELRVDLMGDVHIRRDEPASAFAGVRDVISEADLRLCQLETAMTEKGQLRSDVQMPNHQVEPRMVEGFTAGGIDAVTFAGNNNLDFGPIAMFDTVDLLEGHGIEVVGVGEDLEAAREPLYLSSQGKTVAIVDACSILRPGYAATAESAGLSPLHVSTFYEPLENIYEQPGTPARTVTIADEANLRALCSVIEEAGDRADFVIACFHWGIHFTYDLAMYQPDVAYEAIDAGADAVVGTHPHNLQAIDVYEEKPIFYSLGNFVFDYKDPGAKEGLSKYLQFYGMHLDPEWTSGKYLQPSHTRDTMIVHLVLAEDGVEVEITPVWINKESTPVPVDDESETGRRIIKLVSKLSAEIGTELEYRDGKIVLSSTDKDVDTRMWVRERKQSYPWLAKLQHSEYSDTSVSLVDLL